MINDLNDFDVWEANLRKKFFKGEISMAMLKDAYYREIPYIIPILRNEIRRLSINKLKDVDLDEDSPLCSEIKSDKKEIRAFHPKFNKWQQKQTYPPVESSDKLGYWMCPKHGVTHVKCNCGHNVYYKEYKVWPPTPSLPPPISPPPKEFSYKDYDCPF